MATIEAGTIDRELDAAVRDGRVPGVVAMAIDQEGVLYEGAFGRRALDAPDPMTMDTVFAIASMTKAVTGVAAMQMVEQGRLALDAPAAEVLPELAEPKVLEGFDEEGAPILRPARGTVTLRNLLTHSSGYGYDYWNADLMRYGRATGLPSPRTGKLAALRAPLAADPGTRWQYGIGIDIAGRMVEAASGQNLEDYMREHIFAPLGMDDTAYIPGPDQRARLARTHQRGADGRFTVAPAPSFAVPEFYPGGGGLYSTAGDYVTFLRMLMMGGGLGGVRLLKPDTVETMLQNHLGALEVEPMRTADPAVSNDVDLFPGMVKKWGLTFLINTETTRAGRSAGSVAWAGIRNTYYWLDPKRRRAGVLMTQILPFADPVVLDLLNRFERGLG